MWRNGKGFTLIELMVVIAIILVLALIAVPAYRNMQTRAKRARVQEDLRNIATALEAFYVDWNQYPDAGTGNPPTKWINELTGGNEGSENATVNVSGKTTATGEDAPIVYIKHIPDDPFNPGNKYHYSVSGDTWTLWSVGPDGEDDSGGDDDIVRTNS